MLSIIAIFVSVLFIVPATFALQTDWVGTYSDPTYGGNLTVCVSLVNGVYYGQGLISDVGYLRGTIDSNNVWSGNYYLAGIAAIRGTFSLTLAGDSLSYSGAYAQMGSSITYSVVSASRISSATPSDVACFKSDDSMLTTSTFFNITGAYDNCDNGECYVLYNTLIGTTTFTASYTYNYADGSASPGVSTGTLFANGQVILDNWYETGSDTGIELQVAKNSTHVYDLWWFIPSVSDFDNSLKAIDYFDIGLLPLIPSVSKGEASKQATSNVCYALWTESAESSCTGNSIASNDDDSADFDDEDRNLLITITAFVIVIFVMVLAMLVMMIMNRSSTAPLASQGSSSVQMK